MKKIFYTAFYFCSALLLSSCIGDLDQFRLAFASAADLKSLTSPEKVTRRFIMQKARRHSCELRPLVGAWFQELRR